MKHSKDSEDKMILHGVEIETDIPLPEERKAAEAAKWGEVAAKMEVGNSVLVPVAMNWPDLQAAMLLLKYGVKSEAEGTTGTRVWRTS